MKLNKLLLILLIIIIVCCVLVGAVLLTIDNDSEEVNNTSSINNTTVATEVNSSPEPVGSNDDAVYDPWGYGGNGYYYDAHTDSYIRDDTPYHYVYTGEEWQNIDQGNGLFRGGSQSVVAKWNAR